MEGRLHTPGYTLTIKECRHKFYRPVVDTQNEGRNIKCSPSTSRSVTVVLSERLHIQSGTHQPRAHLLLKLRYSQAKLCNISLSLADR